MQVAYRYRQRIRRIGWLRNLIELQEPRDHQLHLLFLRLAISHDCRLDGERRVFRYQNLVRRRRQHRYAPNLPQFQRRFHIDRIKDVFNGDPVWLVIANKLAQFLKYCREPIRKIHLPRKSDPAKLNAIQLVIAVNLNHAVTSALGTAVDSQDAHLPRILLDAFTRKHGAADTFAHRIAKRIVAITIYDRA